MKLSFQAIALAVAKAAGLGVIVNAILFFVGTATGLISETLVVTFDGKPLGLMPVVMSSIMPVIVAGLIYWLLVRFTKRGDQIFQILSLVLLVLSFFSPFSVPDIPVGMAIMLNVMHVVVAGAVVWFFLRAPKTAA